MLQGLKALLTIGLQTGLIVGRNILRVIKDICCILQDMVIW